MSDWSIPEGVRRLAERRADARRSGDFAAADALREAIRAEGFDVTDTPSGWAVRPRRSGGSDEPNRAPLRPAEVPSLLEGSVTCDASIHWLVEGWPDDVARGMESFRSLGGGGRSSRHVVVEVSPDDTPWPSDADVVRLPMDVGWGAARNAGLKRSTGKVVVVVDGSIEVTGDVLGPLIGALEDRSVGVTGPFGIVSPDLHEFQPSDGPDVDAVEGYLMAFRRELLIEGLRFDEKFRFYRTADIELSFQVKARGLRATVTPVPVRRHEHRTWAATPEEERARLSKRNFYRFLDRWRGRTDLLVRPAGPEGKA